MLTVFKKNPLWNKKRILAVLLFIGFLGISSPALANVSWTELQPMGNIDGGWHTVSSNTDGTKLTAADYGYRLYHSTDSGATWTETRPAGDTDQNWTSAVSSGDGLSGAVISYGGRSIPTIIFTANQYQIGTTTDVTLTWTSTHATSCTASGDWSGSKATSGSETINSVASSKSFVLTCTGAGISVSSMAQVAYNGGLSLPTVTLNAGPIAFGSSTYTVTWTSSNVSSCIAASFPNGTMWSGSRPTTGSATIDHITSNISFTLTCDGANGSAAKTASITFPSHLYRSSGSGVNWIEVLPGGDTNWSVVAMSSDGSFLIAGAFDGRLYRSANGGSTWTETRPAGDTDQQWKTLAASNNGTHLIAGVENGRLYLSTDSGTTWTETRPAGDTDRYWSSVASSSDGTHLIAASSGFLGVGSSGDRMYVSSDSGAHWTETQPAGDVNKHWTSVASDGTGTNLIAGVEFGNNMSMGDRLYISSDGGANWSEAQPAGNINALWLPLTISSNGAHMIAGVYAGRLYRSSIVVPTPTATLTADPTTLTGTGSSTLTWSSTNATSCTASGGWSGTKATSGSETVNYSGLEILDTKPGRMRWNPTIKTL